MKNRFFWGSIISLIFGTTIYLLLRTSSLKVFGWLEIVNINFLNSDIRKFSIDYLEILPNWFLYSLPDGLWIFSYVCLMMYIWNFKINAHSLFWISIIPFIAIFSEFGQAIYLISGTFDFCDILFYILGFNIPFLLLFNNKHDKLLKIMSKNLKTIASIGAFAFFAFIAFGSSDDKEKTSNKEQITTENATESTNTISNEKKWTTVYSFSGNGLKKSPTFELTGNEARIKYSYKADGNVGIGMFAVYVVDEGEDIMKTGGFPEVMTQAENEESESTIQKSEGKYYLNINASGSWTVSIEELQ